MSYRDLTDEEHDAIEAFADEHGRRWKDTLVMTFWYNARLWQGPAPTMGATLQALRNEFGNGWLYKHFVPRAGSPADEKPTREQLKALQEIRGGAVRKVKHGQHRFLITGPANPSLVGRVVALRWARWPQGPFRAQTCELTVAGIRLLAQHRPTPALAPACAAE